MSHHTVEVDEESKRKDAEFLENLKARPERRIKRHSLQARITHDVTIICCIWLMISGLFVFVPALAQWAGSDVVFVIRMSHRVIGLVYIIVPLISAILAPKGVAHIWHANITKWTKDDILWMALFFPYLFGAKWIHMPDQDLQKSGQRFADGMLWIFGFIMAISGLVLLLGSTLFTMSAQAHTVWLFIHDLGFFVLIIFVLAHIFLGAGIFQPYRGSANLMFGDGTVSESDALYHWGHWARKELDEGTNVELASEKQQAKAAKKAAKNAAKAMKAGE